MSPKKRTVFKEPQVIVAIIGLVGVILTGVFSLISKSRETSADTAPSMTNTLSPVDKAYTAKLLSNAQEWPLVAKDSFDSNKLKWSEEDYSSSKSEGILSIKDGVYLWNIKSKTPKGSVFWPRPAQIENVPNFYAAVDLQSMAEPEIAKFGLTFRNQGIDNHYEFTISSSQQYELLYKPTEDPLINSTSKEIVPFERNRIAVIGIGNQFWFYINDVYVDYREHDGGPLSGNISFIVVTMNDKDWVSVTFDNFELREMP
jgi:hypothetical protein